ncbi:MAG: OmpA family protein, partial [Scytonema sp. PMC 1069.18]|nr:OmpA family protein [Scytonema sp. PMC 1069.18]
HFIDCLVPIALIVSVNHFAYPVTAKPEANFSKTSSAARQLVTPQKLAVEFSEIQTPTVNFPKEIYPEVKFSEITSPQIRVQENEYLTIITLPTDILFDQKDKLRADAKDVLKQVSQTINNRYPENWLQILGHTNSKGSQEYNFTLSEQRVAVVERWLREEGAVNVSVITKQGYGDTQPVSAVENSDCSDNMSGWKNNGRIEIVVQKLNNQV